MLNGRACNGSIFAGLVAAYVDAMNSGGVPTISSAWEGVTAAECRNAEAAAAALYVDSILRLIFLKLYFTILLFSN